MTIDEAIKINKLHNNPSIKDQAPKLWAAQNLGIEALKQVKESRFDPSTWTSQTLPGETKD